VLLGAHESTAGGLPEAFPRALADKAEAVQIFTKSNRMWHAREIGAEEAALFRSEGAKHGLLATASVHASYLINLGAGPGEAFDKSVGALADELRRCELVGIDKLVLHPGSNANIEEGLERIALGVASALEAAGGRCKIVLETAAGQGSALGRTFEELRRMLDGVPKKLQPRTAICLDTCHVFAAGYDLSSAAGWDETFQRFDDVLGLATLACLHLNDSKKPLGCRVDRHERPGAGCIGPEAFQRLLRDARFADLPGYLELPPEENLACLEEMKAWRKPGKAAEKQERTRKETKSRVAPKRTRG
jgi:deoxyribonuclease IV